MVNGKSVARLSLATSQSWKDKNTGEKKEKTEWHRVVVFNEGFVIKKCESICKEAVELLSAEECPTEKMDLILHSDQMLMFQYLF